MAGIVDFMSQDHDRLDALYANFRQEKDASRARDWFTQFDSGLRAHISWEEDILFPPFEEKTGMREVGPTAVMRMEHQQIKQLLKTIGENIGNPGNEVQGLEDVLSAHNQKEENVLYPWLDQMLSAQETKALLGRIKGSTAGA